jgi:hypothetical protein
MGLATMANSIIYARRAEAYAICLQCKVCGNENLGDGLEISCGFSEDFLEMSRFAGWRHLG